MFHKALVPLAIFLWPSAGAVAVDANVDDVQQIEAEVAAYVEAFNAQDAASLARHWSDSGVYVRPADGVRLVGRQAIQRGFETLFAQRPGAVLSVKVDTIRFVTADVAIEEGTAEVSRPDADTIRSGYSAVHVKRDGQWQVDSIREIDLPAREEATGGRLAELAWLVGEWVDQSEIATVETSVSWTKNRSFLSYSFKVSTGNIEELEGTQVVGWDPAAKIIRSWMFDSDGGIGEGVWSRQDNRWFVKFHQVLADGRLASSTNIYTYVDANTFTWQSVDREVDGKPLADVEPVTVVRKPAADSSETASN